jgi:hypothetical protein
MLGLLMAFVGYNLVKKRGESRLSPIDYSGVPSNDRIFYELISDTMAEMRQKVGDRALGVAEKIDGLTIDRGTGRVMNLTKNPSKIIAELVLGYEKALGKKVSFALRR